MRWMQFAFYAFLLGCAVFIFERLTSGIMGGFKSGMSRKAGV